MLTKASLYSLPLILSLLASLVDSALGAPIEEALKSLKGLSGKERLARVESEARKEGSVRWASSTPQPWAEPALQIFRKRYPTIQVEYMRQSGRVLAERIVREHRAGKYDIDIVGTSAVTFAGMKDAGVIAPYLSPEASQLRQNMRDPAGWWVAYFGNIQAIICNGARVKSAPADWKDFLDPRWRGEFSIDDTRYEWFYALQQIHKREEANRLITGFRRNGVNLRRGGTLRAQLVAAGEESCGLGVYLNNVRDLLVQNAPVTYSAPEPVIVVPVINMMARLPPDGRVMVSSLGDYKIRCMRDIPPLVTSFVTSTVGPGPFSTKAVGEAGISIVAPAISNAVYQATGVRITQLPITAEKIMGGLASGEFRGRKFKSNSLSHPGTYRENVMS